MSNIFLVRQCWDQIQGLTHARQTLNCWVISPALFLVFCFCFEIDFSLWSQVRHWICQFPSLFFLVLGFQVLATMASLLPNTFLIYIKMGLLCSFTYRKHNITHSRKILIFKNFCLITNHPIYLFLSVCVSVYVCSHLCSCVCLCMYDNGCVCARHTWSTWGGWVLILIFHLIWDWAFLTGHCCCPYISRQDSPVCCPSLQ